MERIFLFCLFFGAWFHVERAIVPRPIAKIFHPKHDGCRIDSIYYDLPWGYYAEGDDQGACL